VFDTSRGLARETPRALASSSEIVRKPSGGPKETKLEAAGLDSTYSSFVRQALAKVRHTGVTIAGRVFLNVRKQDSLWQPDL